jgi:hypothetical protein
MVISCSYASNIVRKQCDGQTTGEDGNAEITGKQELLKKRINQAESC